MSPSQWQSTNLERHGAMGKTMENGFKNFLSTILGRIKLPFNLHGLGDTFCIFTICIHLQKKKQFYYLTSLEESPSLAKHLWHPDKMLTQSENVGICSIKNPELPAFLGKKARKTGCHSQENDINDAECMHLHCDLDIYVTPNLFAHAACVFISILLRCQKCTHETIL